MRKGFWVIFGAAVITALVANHFSPRGIAWFGDWDAQKGVVSARPRNDVVVHAREINDIQKVKAVYDKGDALFVDARAAESFQEGHIRGATSLPVGEMDRRMDVFIEKYPFETHIITYCSGRQCDESHILADFLKESGYMNVQVFVDGFSEWEREGYPIE